MTNERQMEEAPVDAASQPFVGRWNELISTTNWEKGRIIAEWRDALVASDANLAEYSDEAWAQHVGGVTPQHVGRLRRVFQRFGGSQAHYDGLSWSHFQAAVEWSDPEMWLEGAVQNQWSIAAMRRVRWETLGSVEELRPKDGEIVATETDEDFVAHVDEPIVSAPGDVTKRHGNGEPTGPVPEGPDFGDEGELPELPETDASAATIGDEPARSNDKIRLFADLPPLPDDLSESFEALKLALLRHKTDGWREVACADVLAALDALKALAVAPADGT